MASFRNLRNIKYDPPSNGTASLTALPSSVLDAVIPGYSILSRLLADLLGFDITAIVSVALLIGALITGSSFLSKHIGGIFLRFFSSSINIDSYDPIYDHILAWAATNAAVQKVRVLRGHSAGEAVDSDDPSSLIDLKVADDQLDEDSIFNFNNWAAKAPPRYEPHSNSGLFWHKSSISGKWNIFSISRDREQVRGGWMGMMVQDREKLTLTVLGRSTKPLKDLIVEMRDAHLSLQTSMTVIRRPAPKEHRGRGRHAWNKVASRPSRPMATVVLDDVQKSTILRDMNEFLHPRMPRWYANRGIPYRRGYLFHGPPGTGKTSLSFALAGVFGLDIYCLSLSEATLTEEDLILLFNSLPKRCVVLLEDIDSAGVLRKKEEEVSDDKKKDKLTNDDKKKDGEDKDKIAEERDKDSTKPATDPSPTEAAATAIATAISTALESSKAKQAEGRPGRGGRGAGTSPIAPDGKPNTPGITLSGLLNAIDGVASQEGRVLVMTTNFPEKLDDALIRPGRVDLKIGFAMAGRKEMRELFRRMYDADGAGEKRSGGIVRRMSEVLPKSADGEKDDEEVVVTKEKVELLTPPGTPNPTTLDLEKQTSNIPFLARLFAGKLPSGVFSPAEIQGFLLTRKKSPVQAVLDVDSWRDEEMARKEKGKNVVEKTKEDDEEVQEEL